MPAVKIQKVSYGGWDNCVCVSNDIVGLVVTVDVGPRIIRYGFTGRENELCEVGSTMGLTGGDEWRIYGGHRLWHSPEDRYRTYEPDNFPVNWEAIRDGIKTVQTVEKRTGIIKEMEIALSPESSRISVLHRLTNAGSGPLELAVWSISAMAPGGMEVVPQTIKNTGLLPNRQVVLWPYTQFSDRRLKWGDTYIVLQQIADIKEPVKFGISNENGWAAYFNHGHLFIKYYTHNSNARYPDFGVSYETYTNDFMLEMETLSPLTEVHPGNCLEHMENWDLLDKTPMPSNNEDDITRALAGKVPPLI